MEMSRTTQCPICLEPFEDPKVLSCCHTFCKKCLERIVKEKSVQSVVEEAGVTDLCASAEEKLGWRRQTTEDAAFRSCRSSEGVSDMTLNENFDSANSPSRAEKWISCPVCSNTSLVPLEGFPADYQVIQEMECEKLKSNGKLNEEACAACEKNIQEFISRCVDCEGSLCESCASDHNKLKVYSKHTVMALSDVTTDMLSLKVQGHTCDIHQREISLYCNRCDQLICLECSIKAHRQCTGESMVCTIEEADKKVSNEICELKSAAELKLKHSNHCKEVIASTEKKVVETIHYKELENSVNEAFDELLSDLRKCRDTLLAKIEERDHITKKQIWAQKNAMEMLVSKIESGLRFVERSVRCRNVAERLKMNTQGRNVLKDATAFEGSEGRSLPKPLVMCLMKSSQDVLSDYCTLRELNSSDITIFDMTNPKLGQPANIIIQSAALIKSPNVEMQYGHSMQTMDSNAIVLYESAVNEWTIEFVPRCCGKHVLVIIVGGVVIHSFEFEVGGILRRGNRVQRGPDWEYCASDTNLLSGTVMSVKAGKVIVRWQTSDSEEQSSEMQVPLIEQQLEVLTEPEEAADQEELAFGENFSMQTSDAASEPEESAVKMPAFPVDYEATQDYVIKEHAWGDKFEIELLLR